MSSERTAHPTVSFDYSLTGTGWARARLGVGHAQLTARVSYLTDGLGDLLRAMVALAEGAHDRRILWVEEPGGNELAFARRSEMMMVQVWHYPDAEQPDEPGYLRLHESCLAADFFAAVERGSAAVLAAYGSVGYKDLWVNHDFPARELAALSAALPHPGFT